MKQLHVVLTILFCLLLASSAQAENNRKLTPVQTNSIVSEKRIALVIGNSAYTSSPLKNPVNDAKDVAAKLRKLGFAVVERHNLTTKQIGRTLSEFRSKLVPGGVALVFYAGHGLQIKGENYLPAVDAEISAEEDVGNQSLAVRQIMDVLDEAKTRLNLVFLDACRNNPYARSFRSAAGDGLARISAPSGTLISYATRPGSVAGDGDGHNGLYTSKLLGQMDSNLQIELALKQVVTAVKKDSQGKQEPWMEGSIEGDFCFAGCVTNQEVSVNDNSPTLDQVYQADHAGRIDDAQRMMNQVLKDHPNSAKAHFVKAELSIKQGQISNAKVELNTAERLQPDLSFATPQAVQDLKNRIESVTNATAEKLSCRKELGQKVASGYVEQCTQISPATHPPCNDLNPCSIIKDEIKRGCEFAKKTKGAVVPKFCEDAFASEEYKNDWNYKNFSESIATCKNSIISPATAEYEKKGLEHGQTKEQLKNEIISITPLFEKIASDGCNCAMNDYAKDLKNSDLMKNWQTIAPYMASPHCVGKMAETTKIVREAYSNEYRH